MFATATFTVPLPWAAGVACNTVAPGEAGIGAAIVMPTVPVKTRQSKLTATSVELEFIVLSPQSVF
jgi:hypothetical protein